MFLTDAEQRGASKGSHRKQKIEKAAKQEEKGPVVQAPLDGIFYRRPKPEAPPYVQEGDTICKGDVLGLIEVMKTFYPFVFDGKGLPERAKIERFLVEDGKEVRQGQGVVRWKWIESNEGA